MFDVKDSGNWPNITKYLTKRSQAQVYPDLDKYGQMGVDALARATPTDSGETANSWKYRIITGHATSTLEWYNTNAPHGTSVAILIQYGHGNRGGGWVQGIDYINPAMARVFQEIADDIWKEVKNGR